MSNDAFMLELARRIAELETRVAQLEDHEAAAAAPASPDADPEVRDAISRGNLIAAIKRYRELTGLGLAEAKEAVERLQRGF